MERQVVARFLVDHPIGAGAIRAILDTLVAQGGAYEPQLVHRPPEKSLRRITAARPAALLDDVGEGGASTTFLRVAEGRAYPVLSFSISERPRSTPTRVILTVPGDSINTSNQIEQVLGISKGLYLFLESRWGTVGLDDPSPRVPSQPSPPVGLGWANFFGPQAVAGLGPARLLTSMAFIVEILPDGGIMLVTHPAPYLAASPEGIAARRRIAEAIGLDSSLDFDMITRALNVTQRRRGVTRIRGFSPSGEA